MVADDAAGTLIDEGVVSVTPESARIGTFDTAKSTGDAPRFVMTIFWVAVVGDEATIEPNETDTAPAGASADAVTCVITAASTRILPLPTSDSGATSPASLVTSPAVFISAAFTSPGEKSG